MNPLTRSLLFHLVMPYALHLAILIALVRANPDLLVLLRMLPWLLIVAFAVMIVAIPFGMAHVIQACRYAPAWSSWRSQFLVGLLNPSLALITLGMLTLCLPGLLLHGSQDMLCKESSVIFPMQCA